LPAGATCPAGADAQVAALEQLWEACAPTWDAVAAAHPGKGDDWRCLEVAPLLGDARADVFLRTLGRLHGASVDVRTAPLGAPTGEAPGCDGTLAVDALDPEQLRAICAPEELEATLTDEHPRGPFERVLRARQP
ncbi:MAG: hypothetical protein KC621_30615, partial [Myxococcales bacterium]|nr:hypothetical protein [Myxococcales bacterium]